MAMQTFTLRIKESQFEVGVKPTSVTVTVYPLASNGGAPIKVVKDTTGGERISGHVKHVATPTEIAAGVIDVVLPDPRDVTLSPTAFGYRVRVVNNYFTPPDVEFGPTEIAANVSGGILILEDVTPTETAAFEAITSYATASALTAEAASRVSGDTNTLVSAKAYTDSHVPNSPDDIGAEAIGVAATLVANHIAATDPHGDRAYTNAQITALINGAPGILNTLGEIAAQLATDESAVSALTTAINGKLTAADLDVNAATVGHFYVDPTNGSDSNSGRAWHNAVATIQKALDLTTAAARTGVVHLSHGIHNVTATLVIPQAVKVVGTGSLLGQETEIVWTGANDGSYAIRTAGDASGNDWTRGQMSGFLLRPNASKPGGGAYTNLNGLYGRNLQNGAHIYDIRVQNFPGENITADWSNAGVPAAGFPGFVTFSRVWSTGGNVNWHMYGGFTSVKFDMCAGDVSSNTSDVFIIDPPTGGSNGGRGANYIFMGFKSEDNGTPTGAGADANYFTINTDVSIGFDGCSAKRGTPGTKPWINYTLTPASQNAVTGGIPVDIRNSHTSNFPVVVKGPDAANWLVPPVGTGGQSMQVAHWSGQEEAPKKWRGTHSGLVSDGLTVNATSGAVNALKVNSAPGATVAPVEIGAPVFTDSFTAADSASAIPAPDAGPTGTAAVGTWGISSNKAYLVSATHNAIYIWAGVGSEGTLHADITRSSGQAAPGVAFRVIDSTHGLYIWYKSTTGELLLQKHAGAAPVGLKAATVAWTPGTTKRLSVSMVGPVITAFLDGVQVMTYTLTGGDEVTYGTASGIGLRQLGNVTADTNADDGGSRYDNVSYVASVVRVNTAGALQVLVAGVWTTVSTSGGVGALLAANNLSDLANASTSRTNLGLGTAATQASTAFEVAGAGASAQAAAVAASAQRASNLSDLADAPTARTNLGLGTAAVTNTGTGASNTILGNDARLTDARTPTAHAASHGRNGSDVLTPQSIGAAPGRLSPTAPLMAETIPRYALTTQAPSAGVVYLARVTLQAGAYTSVTVCPTAGGTGLTNAFFGLYDTTSLNLLATSSSAVTALQTTVGTATAPPATAMTCTVATAGDYWLALLIGAGTTMPTLIASAIQSAALTSLLAPNVCHRHNTTGQTSLPATATLMTAPSAMLLPWMRYE